MNRILFVDDEPRVLEGLENLLFEQADAWEMAFVSSANDALAACEERPFDVVVSDMRMPGVDGAALLAEVRERWPSAVRIILSGQAGPDQTERALPIAHELLSKPTPAEQLVRTITRAPALQRSCRSDALRSVVGHLDRLPARPETYERFAALLHADAPVDEIAAVIERDPALVAGLLRVARSAFFATATPIERVRDAIVRLGLAHTSHLVLAICAFDGLGNERAPFAEETFAHCAMVAQVAREVAPPALRQRAFLAGLLHDIGHVVMARTFPLVYRRMTRGATGHVEGNDVREQELFGFDHSHCGAYLIRLWNIDEDIAQAIEFHHDPLTLPPEHEHRTLALAVWAGEVALAKELEGQGFDEAHVLERAAELLANGAAE